MIRWNRSREILEALFIAQLGRCREKRDLKSINVEIIQITSLITKLEALSGKFNDAPAAHNGRRSLKSQEKCRRNTNKRRKSVNTKRNKLKEWKNVSAIPLGRCRWGKCCRSPPHELPVLICKFFGNQNFALGRAFIGVCLLSVFRELFLKSNCDVALTFIYCYYLIFLESGETIRRWDPGKLLLIDSENEKL